MSQKKKTTAQSKRPRKAPSNQTGGTAWGKKAAAAISGKMQSADVKKLILLNFPYIIAFYMVEKAAWLYRHCNGDTIVDRLMVLFMNFGLAYKSYLPSFHPFDLLVGLIGAAALKAVIYFKGKNAKKYRQGEEYGSARWGNAKDIEPFIDPVFENNVLLTQTERLMMSGRPKHPKYARNKNVIVIGGSGSGKTRFFVKPNLMQMPEKVSYVCTDPKGTIIIECGKMLSDAGYKIKVLNTINFKKSMHYNPFHYIRSEKDILKLVNTIIANTKGDGEKSGEDFWVKAERLLYCALIGYIYYEAPEEEQNFSTLLEFINASEAREDDEEFKNPVDELFEDLEKAKPEHFAVRQYKKYKLAAGKTAKSILISCGARLAPFDIKELRDLMAYDEMELDMLGDQRTAMFVIISDTDDTFNFVVSILYTQLFNLLCDKADDEHSGRLPYHVRLLLDEFANIDKIRSEFITNRQNHFEEGTLTHRQAKYGYALSEDRRNLVLNPESAQVVKLIFQMYLEDMKIPEIARALDAQGVPSPQIQMAKKKRSRAKIKWPDSTIRSILKNPLYIGKCTLTLAKAKRELEVPAIVSETEFQKAQKKLESTRLPSRKKARKKPNLLFKKIYDKESGKGLLCRTSEDESQQIYSFDKGYRCFSGKAPFIESEKIFREILSVLEKEKMQAAHIDRVLDLNPEKVKQCMDAGLLQYRKRANEIVARLMAKDDERTAVYREYEQGSISLEQVEEYEHQYQVAVQKQEAAFKKVMLAVNDIEKAFSHGNPWLMKFRAISIPETLERTHLKEWLDHVWIVDFEQVEVILQESEWKRFFPEEWLNNGEEDCNGKKE